jgi:hypothetical protein
MVVFADIIYVSVCYWNDGLYRKPYHKPPVQQGEEAKGRTV